MSSGSKVIIAARQTTTKVSPPTVPSPRPTKRTPIQQWTVLPKQPLSPQEIKLKSKSQPKLLKPITTLTDGTTIHLNSGAYDPIFTYRNLPPPSHKFSCTSLLSPTVDPIRTPPLKQLTTEQINEIISLRTTDPNVWTVRKLAKKFGVSGIAISILAKCPDSRLMDLQHKETQRIAQLPPSTLQHIRDRQRRRALW